MNDVVTERFAALADLGNDSDWRDVRRRANARRTRVTVPAAAALAAIVAASAFAAAGGWVFSSHDRQVTARTDIRTGSRTWHVSFTTSPRLRARFCLDASSPGLAARSTCRKMGPGAARLGPPFGALELSVPGGQIWAGAAVGFARRIAITDATGRVHHARAVRPPTGTKSPFRYWVIWLPGSTGRSITAYGANGRSIRAPLR